MECVECRNTGVTKRGVCPKCPAGVRFLARSDGGIRVALDPEFARRFTEPTRRERGTTLVDYERRSLAQEALERGTHPALLEPEVRAELERFRAQLDPMALAEYERARVALGLVPAFPEGEKGPDADREQAAAQPPPPAPAAAAPSAAGELELLRENVELRRKMDEQRQQLEQLLLKSKTEPEPGQGQ